MTTVTAESLGWQASAACRSMRPDEFFPDGAEDAPATAAQVDRAKQVCASCPVRRQCLDFAVATRQRHGVWGGTTEDERHLERRRQLRRARTA